MRSKPYLGNQSSICLLTFILAVLFVATLNVLPAAVGTSTPKNFHFHMSNNSETSTTDHAEAVALQGVTVSVSPSATFQTSQASSSTTSSLYEVKTSIFMNSSNKNSNEKVKAKAKENTANKNNKEPEGVSSTILTSHTYSTATATATTTTTSAVRNLKSTKNSQLDLVYSKNRWSSADAISFKSSSLASYSSKAERDSPRTFHNKHHHEHHWGPFFEERLNSTDSDDNLISMAHLFTEAVLNCRVGMLKDKTVMWVRRSSEKVSLLTVGNVTYSGDPRIRVKFQYPNNWRLLINPTQKEDAGVYMCQVSTHPPRVFTTKLIILEPPLRLIDDQEREMGDRYYKSGSTIELQCQVSRSFISKEKPKILKNIQQLNQNPTESTLLRPSKGKISQPGVNDFIKNGNKSEKHSQESEIDISNMILWERNNEPIPVAHIKRSIVTEKWYNSRISIADSRITDSGNYSCSIGRLFTAIVHVQVLTGETEQRHLELYQKHLNHAKGMIDTIANNTDRASLKRLLAAVLFFVSFFVFR